LRPKASENPGAECLTNVEVELGEIHVGGETGVEANLQGDEVDGGHREGRLSFSTRLPPDAWDVPITR
jgi:hypothetical protein